MLEEALADEFSIAVVTTGEDAVPYLVNLPPQIMVIDKNLPGMSGLDLLKQVKELQPDTEVIVITGYASLGSAIEAMRFSAYDYLMKPFDDIDLVREKIRRAGEKSELASERRLLMEQVLASNQELRDAQARLGRAYLQTLTSMITALEARDACTRGHSDRVASYTEMIGKELRLAGAIQEKLVDGARLHDLGKIGIREEVLNKTSRLTDDEYKHIQTHPNISADIIGQMEAYAHLVPMVKHHHERYDGGGYPSGLVGTIIPFESRIIAVADTFDAMTSERPYRQPRSHADAFREIRDVSGSQLDPDVVSAFLIAQGRLGNIDS